MKLKVKGTFFFVLFVTACSARAQLYEFQFSTSTPGFSGELFFNTPSGNGTDGEVLEGNSFITTPDGTFTVSKSVIGGPIAPPPAIAWSPAGITALDINLYTAFPSKMFNWTATPTSIGDTQVAAIPLSPALDPEASGTWDFVGAVPEPGTMPLTALGVAAMLLWPLHRNSPFRRTLNLLCRNKPNS